MEIDKNIKYIKILNHPHIYIYVNDEEIKSLSRIYYTCYANFYDDFKQYPEILKQVQLAFEAGICFVKIKRLDAENKNLELLEVK